MPDAVLVTDDVWRMAESLVGARLRHVVHAASGGNSRIYRVEAETGLFALKYYPPAAPGARDRLGAEIAALHYMRAHGVDGIPTVYGYADRFALYAWMDGAIAERITEADVDTACDFLAHLPRLSAQPGATQFILAAEACLSLQEVLAQIARRVERLEQVAVTEPALKDFLAAEFTPLWGQRVAQARAQWQGAEDAVLPQASQCLIPADFGFHNILKQSDGSLRFIDFEYFGWDDPVKLVADTLLHPGYVLGEAELAQCFNRLTRIFSADPQFMARLLALLPLFSLRWALILCNEFLHEKRANRAFAADKAGDDAAEWNAAKQRQLAKALRMLDHPALALMLTTHSATSAA